MASSHLAALSPSAETGACIKLDSDFNISSHLLSVLVSILGFLWYCFSHRRSSLWYPLSFSLSNLSFANSPFLAMPTKTAGCRRLRWWRAERPVCHFWEFHFMVPVDYTSSLHLLVVISHTISTSVFRDRNHHWTTHFDSGFVKHLVCRNPGPWLRLHCDDITETRGKNNHWWGMWFPEIQLLPFELTPMMQYFTHTLFPSFHPPTAI